MYRMGTVLSLTLFVSEMLKIPRAKVDRGGSRSAATSKMERFVIIVNGFQPLTIITKRFILDVAAVLDPPLVEAHFLKKLAVVTNKCLA